MCKYCNEPSPINMVINVDTCMPVSEFKKAMDGIAESLRKGRGGVLEVVEPTNYEIAIEVFKEIAQDKSLSPQDRMDAGKLLLKYV
jgi:hypothetical protein